MYIPMPNQWNFVDENFVNGKEWDAAQAGLMFVSAIFNKHEALTAHELNQALTLLRQWRDSGRLPIVGLTAIVDES